MTKTETRDEGIVFGSFIVGGRPIYGQVTSNVYYGVSRYVIYDTVIDFDDDVQWCDIIARSDPALTYHMGDIVLTSHIKEVVKCLVPISRIRDPGMNEVDNLVGLLTGNAPLFFAVSAGYFGVRPYDHWADPAYADQYLFPGNPPSPYRRMLAEWDPSVSYEYPRNVSPGMLFGFMLDNGRPVYGQVRSVTGGEVVVWLLDVPLDGIFDRDIDWPGRLPRSTVIAEFRLPEKTLFRRRWFHLVEQPLLDIPSAASDLVARPHEEIELFKRADAEKLAAAWFGLIPWDSWRDREWMEKRLFPGTERPPPAWNRSERRG